MFNPVSFTRKESLWDIAEGTVEPEGPMFAMGRLSVLFWSESQELQGRDTHGFHLRPRIEDSEGQALGDKGMYLNGRFRAATQQSSRSSRHIKAGRAELLEF